MWEMAGTIVIGLAKFIFDRIAKRKLNDVEFLKHIEAHQIRRRNAGKTAQDFDDALAEAERKLDNPEKE